MAEIHRRSIATSGRHPGAAAELTVITPVGPGHSTILKRALWSVQVASATKASAFSFIEHIVVDDAKGELGRGRARNLGIDAAETEWLFFLDADDVMRPECLACMTEFNSVAIFGGISKDGRMHRHNVWPCTWRDIALHGSSGTLAMGFFCKREVARELHFDEEMIIGEDYDFYMRLPSFTKLKKVLVEIGYSTPSAGGPRTPEFNGRKGKSNWTYVCNERIIAAFDKDPDKFGVSRNALLAAAPPYARDPNFVSNLVRAST